jgi:hypothetical protein
MKELISRKGAKAQRRTQSVLVLLILRVLLCAFAPLRETFFW